MTIKMQLNGICSRTILSIVIANIFTFPACYAHQVLVDKINFEKSKETIDTNNDESTFIINSENHHSFGKININEITFTGSDSTNGGKVIAGVGLPGKTIFNADELNISGIYGKIHLTEECALNMHGIYAAHDDIFIKDININNITTADSTTLPDNIYHPVATGIFVPDLGKDNYYSFTSTGEINISFISSGESRGLWLSSTNKSSIKINQLNINNINGSVVAAGITAYKDKSPVAHDPIKITGRVSISDIHGPKDFPKAVKDTLNLYENALPPEEWGEIFGLFSTVGLYSDNITFSNGLEIKNVTGVDNFNGLKYNAAIVANKTGDGNPGIIIDSKNDAVINAIENDIFLLTGSKVTAYFTNEASYFNGTIKDIRRPHHDAPLGTAILTFKNGATWTVTGDSRVNVLNFDNGKLITDVNLGSDETGTNKVTVSDTVSGTFNVTLNVSNGDSLQESDQHSQNWFLSQEGGTLKKGDVKNQNGGAKKFDIAFFGDDAQPTDKGSDTGAGKGKWYVVLANQKEESGEGNNGQEVNPDNETNKPPVTEEVDQILSLGASVTQALGMLSETEDLRMRMGDIRYGDNDGLWVRTYARQDSAKGSFGNGFEQDVYGIHLGADHLIRMNRDSSLLLGGTFHYGRSDLDGAAEAGGGKAKTDQYTFKAYATYLKDSGLFADIVLHAGFYDNELKGLNNTHLGKFKANYSNWGYGLSAELGHRFELSPVLNTWFIEPSAQLTWFHADGKSFQTTTGLQISQSDADFITGRLGATVGKIFAMGTNNEPDSTYLALAMKAGMLYQFDGDQTVTAHGTDDATVVCANAMDMKGARAYYGITADWKVNNKWRIYGQISREEGSGYTKDYDASMGVRYTF